MTLRLRRLSAPGTNSLWSSGKSHEWNICWRWPITSIPYEGMRCYIRTTNIICTLFKKMLTDGVSIISEQHSFMVRSKNVILHSWEGNFILFDMILVSTLKFPQWRFQAFLDVSLFEKLLFIRPSSDGTYYGMMMSVRPGLRPSDSPSVRPSVLVSVRPFSALF